MSKSIFDRLTDPKLYTGAHKNRFDAEGKGKGIAGRYDVVDFKGSTNTAVVDKAVTGASVSKKPVVQGQLGAQKFGTQAKKAAVVKLFRNGDKHHTGETFTINTKKHRLTCTVTGSSNFQTITSMTQVYEKVSSLVRLPTGAVRKIWKASLKGTVKEVNEFEDGQMYICTGAEPVDKERLPAAFASVSG